MTIQHKFVYDPKEFPGEFMPGHEEYKKQVIRSLKLQGAAEIKDRFISVLPYEKKIIEGMELHKMEFKMFTMKAWDEFLIGITVALQDPEYNNKRLFIKKIMEELENQPII